MKNVKKALVRIPKPDIIDYTFDFSINKTFYRVFVVNNFSKIYCHEIISFNHKGHILFKNPRYAEELTKELLERFTKAQIPDNELLNTINILKKRLDKIGKERLEKKPIENKSKGRRKQQYLRDAVFWVITNHRSKGHRQENQGDTIRRAFEIFGHKAANEDSFKQSMYALWKETKTAWTKEKNEKNLDHSAFRKFIKSYLSISQKPRKQRTKIKSII